MIPREMQIHSHFAALIASYRLHLCRPSRAFKAAALASELNITRHTIPEM